VESGATSFGSSERFAVIERLGAGGSGEVFRTFDRRFNHEVALKTLFRADPTAILRFKTEFRALADVVHRNLVQLYELETDGATWFFTMELVRGRDFLEYIRLLPSDEVAKAAPGPPPDIERLRDAMRQLAAGLDFLHQAGKLHCDLKPSNLRITDEGRVVLLDFGLVREVRARGDETFELAGTPAYMSPEQIGGQPLGPASDWYAVGTMLYEALTGRRPQSGSFAQILTSKLMEEAPSPLILAPGLPEDLVALCLALLARDPTLRPQGSEVLRRLGVEESGSGWTTGVGPGAAGRRSDEAGLGLLVGRERHLAMLEESFARCRQGKAAVIWVHGSSGMGKSVLIQHFLDQARLAYPSMLSLSGRCYERESVPYKALDNLIDALSRFLRHLPAAEAESLLPADTAILANLFPALLSVEAVEALPRQSEVPDEREQKRRAHVALRELLSRLAARRPLILSIDDLQWGDRDSAGLLVEVLRPPEPPPLLLIGSFRSEERDSSPLLQALLGSAQIEASVRELEVGELTEDAAQALALRLFAESGAVNRAEEALARSIARESQGSPFFVAELVQHALADLSGEQETLPRFDDDSTATNLDRLIRARVRRLPAVAHRLLEVVAVAGQPLDLEVALATSELGDEAPAAVAILRGANLIRVRRARAIDAIEPYHDRIREAVVHRIPRAARMALHGRLAKALEATGRADPETVASHWREAGDLVREAALVEVAAAQAARALAFDRAARLYQRALELETVDIDRRRELWLALGDALSNAGRGFDSANAYLAAVPGAVPSLALELRRRAAEQQLISGHVDAGLETVRTVLQSIGIRMPRTAGQALLTLIGQRLLLKLRGLRYKERPASEIPAEVLLRIDTCRSVAMGLANIEPILGMTFATTHLRHALDAGEPFRVSLAMAHEAAYSGAGGSRAHQRTSSLVEAATTLAEKVEMPQSLGMATFATGLSHYFEGRMRRALDYFEKAEGILRERCTGVSWELDTVMFYRMRVLRFLGNVRQIRTLVPPALKDVTERGDLYAETCLRSVGTWLIRLAEDQPDEALRELEIARTRWSQQGFHVLHYVQMSARAELAFYQGDGELAWATLEATWPKVLRSKLLRVQLALVDSLNLRARAALAAAAARGRGSASAAKLIEQSEGWLRQIEKEKLEWTRPFVQLNRAALALWRDRRDQALELLVAAAAGFDAGAFELHAAVSRRRRGELVGGAVGARLVEEADRWMSQQGIAVPAQMAEIVAPLAWRPQ
jgi:tetratricopeptide (TPR) repeat protein